MSAKFFYYPEPAGNHKVTIDLDEGLGELFSEWDVMANDGRGMDGSLFRSVGRNGEVITIQRDRMKGSEELAMKFIAMQNHLDRGYSVSFTADHTKAWAGPILTAPNGGGFSFSVGANPFRSMTHYTGSNPEPSATDYIVIENRPPGMIQEIIKVQSETVTFNGGGLITATERINFSYPDLPFARWYRYWPVLKRLKADIGKNIVSNEHGLTWSLNLRLVPDYSALFSFHPGPRNVYDPGLIPDSPVSGDLPDRTGQESLDGLYNQSLQTESGIDTVNLHEIWSRIN